MVCSHKLCFKLIMPPIDTNAVKFVMWLPGLQFKVSRVNFVSTSSSSAAAPAKAVCRRDISAAWLETMTGSAHRADDRFLRASAHLELPPAIGERAHGER